MPTVHEQQAQRKPRPSNLPVRRTPLIGREADHAAVRDLVLFGDLRLVTLVGAPGAGKTSLALEVARNLLADVSEGVWYVGLDLADDLTDLAVSCGAALGLVEEAAGEPLDRLQRYLQPRQILLVLDNCEHLASRCGELVDTLLSHCPDLRVLATSRIPLRLRDEATFLVQPLQLPDPGKLPSNEDLAQVPAVSLFVERARAARNTFALEEENASDVVEICRQLAGLPLALELAAARVSAFTPRQIAGRLGAIELVGGRGAASPPWHETLTTALNWSYELLSERERQLFRRLGALTPGWTLEAAEEISERIDGDSRDLFERLHALVEHSLIVADEERGAYRYRTLVPIRQYALQQLRSENEFDEVFRAYASYYRRLAEKTSALSWDEPDPSPGTLMSLSSEVQCFDAAIRWATSEGDALTAVRLCLALWMFWRIQGHLSSGLDHVERALAIGEAVPAELLANAHIEAASLAQLGGDHVRVEQHVNEALPFFREAGRREGEAVALATLADSYVDVGDLERAKGLYEKARLVAGPLDEPVYEAWLLAGLGTIANQEGQAVEAETMLERAAALLDDPGAPGWHRARTLARLAQPIRQRGDRMRAAGILREAIRQLLPFRARVEMTGILEELGQISIDDGNLVRAVVLRGAASSLRDASGAPAGGKDLEALNAEFDEVRGRLGERAFAAAWEHGISLSLDDAAAIALGDGEPEVVPAPSSALASLTRREREVAQLISEGLTNAQIAERLVVAEGTARTHVDRILRKIGCRSRAGIARLVAEEGIAPRN